MLEHMFVHNPNLKGAIAEAEIAASAVKLGIPLFKPVAEHGRSDLVFEIGGELLRVQCKWGALDRRGAVVQVPLSGSRYTPGGYVRSVYTEDEIDLVAVYCGDLDRSYLLPISLCAERRAIYLRLTAPRNSQRACINLASDYEFTGAVAQLAERRRGTAEARGSNPLSSIPPLIDHEIVVGAHEFRNHFGWFMERAAAGEHFLVTRHGRQFARLVPAGPQEQLFAGRLPAAELTPPSAPAPLPRAAPTGSTNGRPG
jgi:prevent-host-death family protein